MPDVQIKCLLRNIPTAVILIQKTIEYVFTLNGVLSSQVQWRILNSTMQSVYIDVTNNGIHSYYYLSCGDEVIIDACKEDTDESLMVENIKIYFDGKLCYLQDNGKVKVSKEFDIDNYDNWTNSTIKKNGKNIMYGNMNSEIKMIKKWFLSVCVLFIGLVSCDPRNTYYDSLVIVNGTGEPLYVVDIFGNKHCGFLFPSIFYNRIIYLILYFTVTLSQKAYNLIITIPLTICILSRRIFP